MSMTRLFAALSVSCALLGLSACGDKPATPANPAPGTPAAPANGTPTTPATGTVPVHGGEPARPTEPVQPTTPVSANDPMVGAWVADVEKCRPEIEKFMQQMVAAAPEKPSPEEIKAGIDQAMEEIKKAAYEVKGDGTFTITGTPDNKGGKWTKTGNTYTFDSGDGQPATGTLNGGSFVMEAMGMKMYFKRR